jgi:ribosomal protein S18 acetylase RimI-like enzyme
MKASDDRGHGVSTMNDDTFTIVRASAADADLARQAMVELHERTPLDESALVAFLSDPANYLLLALEGGRVVGSLNGYALRHPHRHEPAFLLYEIDVRSECRNRGIGTALVESFVAQGRAEGAFEVWVVTNQSNPAAMAMYSQCGLRRPNPDDVMMELTLGSDISRGAGSSG